MSTNAEQLNLARKWRPKTFDSIVGQEIPVRMLKNSLFLKKFFPVYLFAGQRGCGKTSTARIFAAAVNCQALDQFQKDPTLQIPCLSCQSCTAMAQGNHPDFIEIDAASHTGVDNVRTIIESSTYMPLNGQKKVYLIDEAHMLSKAAFNAFLKILEEPPKSVLFILATTEIQKIPPTVISRCFQALFTSLQASSLKEHLKLICSQESVSIDDDALDTLIQETEGCARDALNLLERVRFSGEHITHQTMLNILGKIGNQFLFSLFTAIIDQRPAQVLESLINYNFEQLNPTALWDALVYLLRTLLWVHYGVSCTDPRFGADLETLKNFAQRCSINRLQALAQLLWSQEELFLKTNKKHLFLEMVLIQMCQQVNISDLEHLLAQQTSNSTILSEQLNSCTIQQNQKASLKQEISIPKVPEQKPAEPIQIEKHALSTPWQAFLEQLAHNADPLLNSILAQATVINTDNPDSQTVMTIQLSNDSPFFKDKINESKATWFPLLQAQFNGVTNVTFTAAPKGTAHLQPTRQATPLPQPLIKNQPQASTHTQKPTGSTTRTPQAAYDQVINIQDRTKWPFANLLVRYFPGKIKQTKVYS